MRLKADPIYVRLISSPISGDKYKGAVSVYAKERFNNLNEGYEWEIINKEEYEKAKLMEALK